MRVGPWVEADKLLGKLPNCTVSGERKRLSLVVDSLPHLVTPTQALPKEPYFASSVFLPQAHSRTVFPVSHSTLSPYP